MKNILAPIDFSQISNEALEYATNLAKALEAKLWVLFVISKENGDFRFEERQLENVVENIKAKNIDAKSILLHGSIVDQILDQLESIRADLVVIGSHGRSAAFQKMFGSVSENVLKKSTCPVFVVPPKALKERVA